MWAAIRKKMAAMFRVTTRATPIAIDTTIKAPKAMAAAKGMNTVPEQVPRIRAIHLGAIATMTVMGIAIPMIVAPIRKRITESSPAHNKSFKGRRFRHAPKTRP